MRLSVVVADNEARAVVVDIPRGGKKRQFGIGCTWERTMNTIYKRLANATAISRSACEYRLLSVAFDSMDRLARIYRLSHPERVSD
jgi:hypothetical protein